MPQKQNWFQEASLRFTQSTPWFFRIVIRGGLGCTSMGAGLLGLSLMPSIVLPAWVIPLASHLCVAGVVAATLGKFVTTTPQDLPNNKPNEIPKDVPIDDQQHHDN